MNSIEERASEGKVMNSEISTINYSQSDENSSTPSESSSDEDDVNEMCVIESPTPLVHTEINGAVLPNSDTYYGNVNIESSSKVHLGSKIIYKGSVVINQIINTNAVTVKENENTHVEITNNQESSSIFDGCKKSKKIRKKVEKSIWSTWFIVTICIIILILIFVIGLIILNNYLKNETLQSTTLLPKSTTSIISTTPRYEEIELNLITRKEWNAAKPKNPLPAFNETPLPYVIISQIDWFQCRFKESCIEIIQELQDKAQNFENQDDIIYNFIVAEDGNVYEGRGWNIIGNHTKNYNKKSLGIAFLGNFNYIRPKPQIVDAAKRLLKYAFHEKKVTSDYKMLGENQVNNNTSSPGKFVYEIIKTWDHWSENA